MKYLFLSSNESLEYHPKNTTYDFTVELPQILDGKFSFALLDIAAEKKISEALYVFCDSCEYSLAHDRMAPLLRIATQAGEVRIAYFVKASRRVIQRIRIYITNRNFQTPMADIGQIRCTLGIL